MRKIFSAPALLLAAALVGGLPAGAAASDQFKQSFDVKLSSRAPGKPSGISLKLSLTDPGEPAGKPKRINSVSVQLPAGVRFLDRRGPSCDRAQLVARGPAACPAASKMGTGTVRTLTGLAAPGDRINSTFQAYDGGDRILLFETGLYASAQLVAIFDLRVNGRTLSLDIPDLPLPDGTLASPVDVSLNLRDVVTTPQRCPAAGRWTIRGAFTYGDGSALKQTSNSRCGGTANATAAAAPRAQRPLKLTAKESQYTLLDLGTTGYSHGDQLIFADDLLRGGRTVGEDGRTCTIVRLQAGPRVTVHCTATLHLDGQGQIAAQGLLVFSGTEPPKSYSLPVVGGTGDFKGARGEVRVDEVTEHEDRYAIHLN